MSLQKAYEALMEGDRDSVLKEIEFLSNSDEVIWLRANATEDEDERTILLNQLSTSSNQLIAEQSRRIIEREKNFAEIIDSEPGWKFWKQTDWPMKRKKYLNQLSVVLIIALLVFAIIYITRNLNSRNERIEEGYMQLTTTAIVNTLNANIPENTPTGTAIPIQLRPSVPYPSGRLTITRIESPTDRSVIFGNTYDSEAALPAKGSYFLAIQVEFRCNLGICDSPPEADIGLKLFDGNIVRYDEYSRPRLADAPNMERTAQGQTVNGWYVFEVPNANTPISLLVYWDQDEAPMELLLPQ